MKRFNIIITLSATLGLFSCELDKMPMDQVSDAVFKSRKTKRDGCEKRNAFIETKTKCASNLIRKVTAYLQNQSKTPSLYIKINGIQMDF